MAVRSSGFRWTDFVDLATDHLVAPAVARRLDRSGLHGLVPEVVGRYFSAMLRLNRARNAQLQKEAIALAGALNRIDAVPLFLKGGAGLLTGLYDDPGVRVMSDLDILVPSGRGGDCMDRLTALGYSAGKADRHPRIHSFPPLSPPSGLASVDLHREVIAYPNEGLLRAHEVQDHAVGHKRGGAVFAVPCATHQVILNIAHAQLNDRGYCYGHLPLRSLYDLAQLLRADRDRIDWREVEDRFAATRNRTALDFHCLAAHALLGGDPEQGFGPGLSARLLLGRARFMAGHPGLQRFSDRFVRVFLLLLRELSSADLRARLGRNIRDANWWRRHVSMFWKGGR